MLSFLRAVLKSRCKLTNVQPTVSTIFLHHPKLLSKMQLHVLAEAPRR